MPLEHPVAAVTSAANPPVARWDRYELQGLLGKGGMGAVYRARDRRLDRSVAIKFIHGADPNLTMRLLREARAQAQIDHPNICRIYEVGEVEGRAYIALQLVDGEPLHAAAARMVLDEKIAVMRDVAEAVQEAHRLGIVHRDLKPANILVERTEDGRWFPVVMDFGLAREATIEVGLTESGVPLGTPAYMSPEQARGDLRAVDRRSDVYSLGATLFELLAGRPPFTNTSLAQALAQVLHDDPPAPRSLVPSLPVDLETITLKCLAKDPTQRYPSARALAGDLGHYLAGEPILGRRPSLWQRVRLRARRQRALVVLGVWSLAIIAVVAALGIRAWIISRGEISRTAERTRLAERLGRDAKEIELFLRTAYMLPLHDTRPDRARVREQMRAIAATEHDLGELGDALIHEALGRGHLALHEWRDAADELARAAREGLQTPELHAARGRALGELYHRALEDARRFSQDDKDRLRRQQELAQHHLAPVLAELTQSRASGDDAAVLEALIAFYHRDFAAAEQRARQVAGRAPWLFEAGKLAPDAAYGAAVEAFDHGDYDGARPGLERAAALYAEASEVARSDASIYEAAAQAALQRGEAEFRQGRTPREPLEHALELLDRALRADPDDVSAYTTRAYVLILWYRAPALAGPSEQRPLLDRIVQAATRATEVGPHDARAWDALGNAHYFRGVYEDKQGGDAVRWWNLAQDEIGRALAIDPDDLWANNDGGIVHACLGDSLDKAGRDPTPEYEQAARRYERATAIDPRYLFGWSNQASLYATIAEYHLASGIDPRAAVDSARRTGERGLQIDPNYAPLLNTLARAQVAAMQWLAERSGDPAALATARHHLDDCLARSAQVRPGQWGVAYYRLAAAAAEATFQARRPADPTSALDAGRRALGEVTPIVPASSRAYVRIEAAHLALADALWAARSGRDPAAALAAARAEAEAAIALDPQLAEAQVAAAEVDLQLATLARTPGAVARGLDHADQALQRKPRLAAARAARDALARLPASAAAP